MKQLTKHVWQSVTGLIQRTAEKEMIYSNFAFCSGTHNII